MVLNNEYNGFPWWLRQRRICLQCRRLRFSPWVGKIHWRRKWQPTPVLLPGDSHGQRNLVGYSPRVAKSRTHLSNSAQNSMITSRSIHIAANGIISFFVWLTNIHCLYVPYLFICQWTLGVLSCYFSQIMLV